MNDSIPYVDISSICLYVLGSEDNERDAFVRVRYPEAYKNNLPAPEGIYDLHMGTTDLELQCATCQQSKKLCPGHPGVVFLKYPVQNPLYLKEIQKWLKIICFGCGKPLLRDEKLDNIIKSRIRKDKILREYVKLVGSTKNVKCATCGALHPHIMKDKLDNTTLLMQWYDIIGGKTNLLKEIRLYPHQIQAIFNKISNETVVRMGKPIICHPKKFILTKLRAPPNTIRPDIKKHGGGRSNNNDITLLLQYIVKINEKFPDEIPENISKDLASDINFLELHVYEMIKGSSSASKRGLSNKSNKPLLSIAKRLPRKFGRIRRNLMGRRVNHMARSFITCDPTLRIDELGVPLTVAQGLPVPVHVREYNRDECLIYFMNGRNLYPGCSKIKKKSTGSYHSVEMISNDFTLEIGDIIYRDLIDGDIVGFNRQPSLEPSSITSMYVRVMYEGDTFRINLLSCNFFNADVSPQSPQQSVSNIVSETTILGKACKLRSF